MKINLITKITLKVISLFYNLTNVETLMISKLLIFANSIYVNNGFVYFCKYIKTSRLHVTRYICGKPLYINSDRVALVNGFPKWLLPIKPLLASGNFRIILSILNYSKAFKAPKGVITTKIETIVDPPKKGFYTIPSSIIKSFIATYKLNLERPKYSMKSYYFSKKIGPQGPSITAVFLTTVSLTTDLFISICNIMDNYKGYFVKFSNDLMIKGGPFPSPKILKNPGSVGKISVIEAPEGKSRVIAMLDYYSQFTLKPIHDQIFSLLKLFKSDRTFTQSPYNLTLSQGSSYHSFDLSAATDRMPIHIQKKLLSYLYNNKHFGNDWADLLTKRDFITPEGINIRYNVGTPMGSYTSWAVFTLTHHLIVYFASILSKCDNYQSKYILLGDDIVISDNNLAKYYKRIISNLGVDISIPKTHVSLDTYEFAKRWIHKDREITGLPLRGIITNIKNPMIPYMVLLDFINKGNYFAYHGRLFDLIKVLYTDISHSKCGGKFLNKFTSAYFDNIFSIYVFAVRFTLNLTTSDEIRLVLANATRFNNEYILPQSDKESRIVLMRAFKDSLEDKAYNAMSNISDSLGKAYNYMPDLDRLYISPLFHAVVNRIENIRIAQQDFTRGDISLRSAVQKITIGDLDDDLLWHRNGVKSTLTMSRLVVNALKGISQPKTEQFQTQVFSVFGGGAGKMLVLSDYDHLVPKILNGPFKHLDFSNKSQFRSKMLKHLFY
jgi:hypothetical protein